MTVEASSNERRYQAFDVDTPVIPGITLLEASAGTGKTYQITNLVVRLIVDVGLDISEILVVTFTKAATAELRDRIRLRLGEALRAVEVGQCEPKDGLLVRLLREATDDPARATALRRRLRRAREQFDQALISTIHGFCQRMLQLHAFETGTAFSRSLAEDSSDAVMEAVYDWMVRQMAEQPDHLSRLLRDGCKLKFSFLSSLAQQALRDPDMEVLPNTPAPSVQEWLDAVSALRPILLAEGGPAKQLTAAVHAKGAFCGRTYGARFADGRLEELRSWLEQPFSFPTLADTWVRWFSAAQLREKARSPVGKALAEHEAFAQFSDLVSQGARVRAGLWRVFCIDVRKAVARRHKREDAQSFQDLLRDLDHVLLDPARGPVLAEAIRSQFRAALIDEFQDTDALQWRIFGRVFGGQQEPTPQHFLYLIGDPKQAIYGFRGANVNVYLAARSQVALERQFTMNVNFRSDVPLVSAMNHLLDRPGMFGSADIAYIPVDAPVRPERLVWPVADETAAPLQLVWVDGAANGGSEDEFLSAGALGELIPELVASDIVRLLSGPAQIEARSVGPGDIAVLVRGHAQANFVYEALRLRGVPAVISSQGHVFDSIEALSLQRWLTAMESPTDSHARALAVDPLVNASVEDLPVGSEPSADALEAWDNWLDVLARWRNTFVRDGVMAAFQALLDYEPVWANEGESVAWRVLATRSGERRMTNLHHLIELMHAWSVESGGGLVGLVGWLGAQRVDGPADASTSEIRLEKDDEAVQIVTIHKSKGLQYGIVFAPYLWRDEGDRVTVPAVVSSPFDLTKQELVLLDEDGSIVERAAADARDEGLRLLYVALTRARHRCVVYWPGSDGRRKENPLSAVLVGAPPHQPVGTSNRVQGLQERLKSGEIESASAQFEELARLAHTSSDGRPLLVVSRAGMPLRGVWFPPSTNQARLAAARLSRTIDDGWRRHSYSALTRADVAAQAEANADPARALGFDDDRHADHISVAPPALRPPPLPPGLAALAEVPLARLPSGADAGTCFHALFEHADFADFAPGRWSTGGREAFSQLAREILAQHGFGDPAVHDVVMEGFPGVFTTPLGTLLPDHRLCDISRADRLDELRFDFPIPLSPAGSAVTPAAVQEVLSLRDDCPEVPAAWVERVGELGFSPMAGMMTGSIDLVFRVRDGSSPVGRWYIVDYKSNRLDPHQTGRTPLHHFLQDGLRYEMAHHHYFLQYHIYTLALHRYLSLRLRKNYEYDTHFGGVLYLFFRGMVGADAEDKTTPGSRPGVFCDRPPLEVIEGLDSLFGNQWEEACAK